MVSTYKFNDTIVILENIKNTRDGNPRFRAIVVDINTLENHIIKFTGHYMTNQGEAQWIYDNLKNFLKKY